MQQTLLDGLHPSVQWQGLNQDKISPKAHPGICAIAPRAPQRAERAVGDVSPSVSMGSRTPSHTRRHQIPTSSSGQPPKHTKGLYFPLNLQVFNIQAQKLHKTCTKQAAPVARQPRPFVPGETPRTNHDLCRFPLLPHLIRPQRFNPPQGGEEEEESRMAFAQMRCTTFTKSRSLTC